LYFFTAGENSSKQTRLTTLRLEKRQTVHSVALLAVQWRHTNYG
jgi:hypothetical protein